MDTYLNTAEEHQSIKIVAPMNTNKKPVRPQLTALIVRKAMLSTGLNTLQITLPGIKIVIYI